MTEKKPKASRVLKKRIEKLDRRVSYVQVDRRYLSRNHWFRLVVSMSIVDGERNKRMCRDREGSLKS